MKYATTIVLIFILSSCKIFIHRVVYNSKLFPNYASEKKINKFYDKHSVTEKEYITFSDSNFVQKIKEPGWAFEGWQLYNTDGFRIRRLGDSLKCIASDSRFFKEFEVETMGFIDSSHHLTNDTVLYQNVIIKSESITQSERTYQNFDYTLIIYWSSWRGRYSSNIIKLEEHFVLNNPELRIQVIKVNMDFRKEMKERGLNKWTILVDELNQKKAHNSK